jgi:hypothetical protein
LALVASLLGALACAEPPTFPHCSGNLSIGVDTPNGVPSFRWSGACGVSSLAVVRVSTNQVVWEAWITDQQHFLGPPLRYGQRIETPSGAASAPIPLVSGESYRVTVSIIVDDDIEYGSGEATFIHAP